MTSTTTSLTAAKTMSHSLPLSETFAKRHTRAKNCGNSGAGVKWRRVAATPFLDYFETLLAHFPPRAWEEGCKSLFPTLSSSCPVVPKFGTL